MSLDDGTKKREVRQLDDLTLDNASDVTKIKRLGDKIAALSAQISEYEDLKKLYLAQLDAITGANNVDYNIKGATWTYEEVSGRLYLSEQRLLESGVKMSILAKCKVRSAPYRQIRRDREKKDKG